MPKMVLADKFREPPAKWLRIAGPQPWGEMREDALAGRRLFHGFVPPPSPAAGSTTALCEPGRGTLTGEPFSPFDIRDICPTCLLRDTQRLLTEVQRVASTR